MTANRSQSLLSPISSRIGIEEVPKLSQFVKRSLQAMFSDADSEEAGKYLKQLMQTQWNKEKMYERLASADTPEMLTSGMRRLRREVLLTLAAKDMTGEADFEEVVSVMTALAEVVVDRTVSVHAKELAKRFGVPHSPLGVPQDLLVVGMGKLGGAELNVSSDIDLIFFYDEDGECRATEQFALARKIISNKEFYERLAKKIIPAISELTWEGFVFRVDMRLRPNGDSGPIVGSSEMLEEYLMMQGREWERFAWLKGRVVNGPVFASQEDFDIQKKNLWDIVRPFVYRKYLDFGAISSLTDLHTKIRLAAQKREASALTEGRNIKLGRGGIREIEFIAQTFQVIRGGRNPFLRERSTLKALSALASENVLAPEKAKRLSEIYVFLRNVEHALQYENDQQTQLLPEDEAYQAKIARMLGLEREELLSCLSESSEYVALCFDEIFQTKAEAVSEDWPLGWESGSVQTLPAVADLLRGKGFADYEGLARAVLNLMSLRPLRLINAGARDRMILLVKKTVDNLGSLKSKEDELISKDLLLERYLHFLEVIAGRPTYVSLLLQYPSAAERLIHVLGAGKWAAEYLNRHPLLLDELWDERLSQIDDYTPVDFSDYIERTRARLADIEENDQETRMNLIREVHHARLFRLFLADLAGRLTVERLADQLSALADATLELAMEESWKTVPGRHLERPNFAVIAYGKLGGKELAYASDLDLVFLYEDDAPEAEKIYVRFARRLINWLTVTTGSGTLFDVDLRLRPNGESGMLVSSLESFKKYERNDDGTGAWLWEHQALTRARFSAGDPAIGAEFEKLREEILRRERDPAVTAEEVLKMRERMHEGHVNKTEFFDLKHDAGGMVDVEFIVQYLVLRYAAEYPQLVNNFGNIKLLEMSAEAGLIPKEDALETVKIYRRYRKVQHEFRLNSPTFPVRRPAQEYAQDAKRVQSLWQTVFGDRAASKGNTAEGS